MEVFNLGTNQDLQVGAEDQFQGLLVASAPYGVIEELAPHTVTESASEDLEFLLRGGAKSSVSRRTLEEDRRKQAVSEHHEWGEDSWFRSSPSGNGYAHSQLQGAQNTDSLHPHSMDLGTFMMSDHFMALAEADSDDFDDPFGCQSDDDEERNYWSTQSSSKATPGRKRSASKAKGQGKSKGKGKGKGKCRRRRSQGEDGTMASTSITQGTCNNSVQLQEQVSAGKIYPPSPARARAETHRPVTPRTPRSARGPRSDSVGKGSVSECDPEVSTEGPSTVQRPYSSCETKLVGRRPRSQSRRRSKSASARTNAEAGEVRRVPSSEPVTGTSPERSRGKGKSKGKGKRRSKSARSQSREGSETAVSTVSSAEPCTGKQRPKAQSRRRSKSASSQGKKESDASRSAMPVESVLRGKQTAPATCLRRRSKPVRGTASEETEAERCAQMTEAGQMRPRSNSVRRRSAMPSPN